MLVPSLPTKQDLDFEVEQIGETIRMFENDSRFGPERAQSTAASYNSYYASVVLGYYALQNKWTSEHMARVAQTWREKYEQLRVAEDTNDQRIRAKLDEEYRQKSLADMRENPLPPSMVWARVEKTADERLVGAITFDPEDSSLVTFYRVSESGFLIFDRYYRINSGGRAVLETVNPSARYMVDPLPYPRSVPKPPVDKVSSDYQYWPTGGRRKTRRRKTKATRRRPLYRR
jgi:hypothetical protein